MVALLLSEKEHDDLLQFGSALAEQYKYCGAFA